ncbi:hypothetical protein HNR65_002454 [Desulfosalsimonas propionicica]|uniref:Uncharacterized protein n=1 Tax=Desulfosalsimonas propionicica TaxID=332175 RepID=A0A7W0CAG1_9BACT|nr:hypothetical protein [Desulfosalsimonas propionicica]MBA2882113.1 hypothetical protein [Desulfosalsimonas propionicica]
MYLYWRIQQDLNCLGEVIRFHDPAFANAFHKWVRKNFNSIALAEDFYPDEDSSRHFMETNHAGTETTV